MGNYFSWASVLAAILGFAVGYLDFPEAKSFLQEIYSRRARFHIYLLLGLAVGLWMGRPSCFIAAIGVFVGRVLFLVIKGRGWPAAIRAGILPAAIVALIGGVAANPY